MVKKRVGGAHRYRSAQQATAAGPGNVQQPKQAAGPKPPHHVQRKITKSVKFYDRVLSQSTPQASQGVTKKRSRKSAKTLANLDSLAAELGHIQAAAAGTSTQAAGAGGKPGHTSEQQQQAALRTKGRGTRSSIKRSKPRLALGISESSRLQKVLQHPTYRADPIQAVLNHLQNTLPTAPAAAPTTTPRTQGTKKQRPNTSKQRGSKTLGGGVAAMQE